MDGCAVRVSADGHNRCSVHAPCITPLGFNPADRSVCGQWLMEVQTVCPQLRPSLPAYDSLCKSWNRARRCDVNWADPVVGTELGFIRSVKSTPGQAFDGGGAVVIQAYPYTYCLPSCSE
ncbi:hypothetical protein Pcinc_023935 [Petrolisthes cinctipes]|uniref:Uncharacterized protein n=1 Tax=Petrolisthes cinctipes TaxID=88211 RepID=A0AAE1KDT3_PETCI|nr:hypothetical protein Pcinc_023935 [Petrolisthes cinctipes]